MVTGIGPLVKEMAEEGDFIIVFNDNAPESLAEMSV
ncbi:MAG: PTS glucitol/sorbitol transporter subunit IIA, partial [Eubacterium sp.]